MEVVAAHALARPQPWAVAGRREIEHPAGRERPDRLPLRPGEPAARRLLEAPRVGVLRMPPLPHEAFLRDMKGHVVAFSRTESGLHLPVGEPLLFDPGGAPAEKVVRAFQEASLLPAPAPGDLDPRIAPACSGACITRLASGLKDPGALADWIVCTGKPDRDRMPSWAPNLPSTSRRRTPTPSGTPALAIGPGRRLRHCAPGTQISRDPRPSPGQHRRRRDPLALGQPGI